LSSYHICHAYTIVYCEAFTELVDLLEASLRDLGHTVTKGRNQFRASATNILLGGNMLKASTIPPGIKLIVYQLEQLHEGSTWWNDDIRTILKRADEVWDYDPSNIAFLKEHLGIEAKHVPIGYHKALIRVPRREKDIDCLHFGSMNERRQKIIESIEAAGTKVHCVYNMWGRERDEMIARSKVVLNLHYYDLAIFEQVRVSYLLNNAVTVLSEDSKYVPYNFIDAMHPEFLPEAVKEAIRLEMCGCDGFTSFREGHHENDILKGIL
jgi:hypothetical protein